MRNTSYLDCRMRCSAAVLLHLPHSGHVLPPAVRSQLTTALQLSQFFIFLLRANVFDLCFVQCNVLALFHHHELNPLQTPSKPQRVFGLSRTSASELLRTRRTPGSAGALSGGAVPVLYPRRCRSCRERVAVVEKQSIDVDGRSIVTVTVNSFRIWLDNSCKWQQMIISSCAAGAEGNE